MRWTSVGGVALLLACSSGGTPATTTSAGPESETASTEPPQGSAEGLAGTAGAESGGGGVPNQLELDPEPQQNGLPMGGAGGAAPALEPYCPSVPAWPEGTVICSDDDPCEPGYGCALSPPVVPVERSCPLVVQNDCSTDEDCAMGSYCLSSNDECGIESFCQTGWTTDDECDDEDRCDGHRCVGRPCVDGGLCPTDETCDPSHEYANTFGCTPISCEEGYQCGVNTDCVGLDAEVARTRNGCAFRQCGANADCDCGVCIASICRNRPGVCGSSSNPPG